MSVVTADFAIRACGISKQYHIGATQNRGTIYERVASLIGGRSTPKSDPDPTIWALRDVSFEVPRAHVMGVIGRNGSGKSTLMRVLARITAPTHGTAETVGRVAALLEAGTGFHPELSGRDNIALSGAILGMRRDEIKAHEKDIIEFAEVGKFLDTAVKYYSTGMFLRLAFSVSVHLAAEIMLVDEVLAVGDAAFLKKCQERIRTVVAEGRSVVFISHSAAAVSDICQSAIVLDRGMVRFSGETNEALAFYQSEILGIRSQAGDR